MIQPPMAKLAEIDFNKIQMENGMLKFDSKATMLETISKLREANHLWRQFYNQAMEAWMKKLPIKWPLMKAIHTIGFNNKPVIFPLEESGGAK
ncbi:MAG: hypothetical protein R2784_02560 [Saprospiraceae bacterium]